MEKAVETKQQRVSSKFKIKINNRTKRVNRSKSGDILITLALLIFGVFSFLPMLMAICQSLKPLNELFLYPPTILVKNPTLANFKLLFSLMSSTWVPFSRYLFNTVFVTVVGTVGNVIICSMAAYPLAKHKAPGVSILFSMVVFSLMFYPAIGDVANYMTMQSLHWTDTYWAIIVPATASSLGLFLMRQFMLQIPDSLLEAAKIDGAGEIRIFWTIIMPAVKSAWMTLAIFAFQSLWNLPTSSFIYTEELKTLSYAMSQIVTGGIARQGAAAAVGVVMMSVPVLFFVFCQNQIIETMATSGMKE